jgi:hypothetical protein
LILVIHEHVGVGPLGVVWLPRQRAAPRVIYVTWTFQVGYFVTMRRGADGVGAAGEITNVTHVFQPSGRFSAANSL